MVKYITPTYIRIIRHVPFLQLYIAVGILCSKLLFPYDKINSSLLLCSHNAYFSIKYASYVSLCVYPKPKIVQRLPNSALETIIHMCIIWLGDPNVSSKEMLLKYIRYLLLLHIYFMIFHKMI